jgi:hypothetical protein
MEMVEGRFAHVPRNVVNQQGTCCTPVVGACNGPERLLARLETNVMVGKECSNPERSNRTVSQIWSLICLLSIVTMRAPNSTPGWQSETMQAKWQSPGFTNGKVMHGLEPLVGKLKKKT